LSTTEAAGENCTLRYQLKGDLAAAALETAPDGNSLPTDLVHRVVKWEVARFQESQMCSLWHRWAAADRCGAFVAAQDMADWLGPVDQRDAGGSTPLDCAISSNSSMIAEELMKAACSPRKPYLIEHRSATMVKLLEKHRPKDAMASTRHAVSATNVFKAARESDMRALEVYKLDGASFGQLCPDGKTAFFRW
jgi:hypothetical protein